MRFNRGPLLSENGVPGRLAPRVPGGVGGGGAVISGRRPGDPSQSPLNLQRKGTWGGWGAADPCGSERPAARPLLSSRERPSPQWFTPWLLAGSEESSLQPWPLTETTPPSNCQGTCLQALFNFKRLINFPTLGQNTLKWKNEGLR